MKFNEKFKTLRESLKLTQKQFAEELEIDLASINRYENGKSFPSFKVLYKLALKFNINLNWLLIGDGEMFIFEEGEHQKNLKNAIDKDITDDEMKFLLAIKKYFDSSTIKKLLNYPKYIELFTRFANLPRTNKEAIEMTFEALKILKDNEKN